MRRCINQIYFEWYELDVNVACISIATCTYLRINHNTIKKYILIIYELSNFDHVLDVMSQTRLSSGNQTHETHTNSLIHYPLYYYFTQSAVINQCCCEYAWIQVVIFQYSWLTYIINFMSVYAQKSDLLHTYTEYLFIMR